MGLTLTEKILKNHLVDGEFIKGSEIGIKIDQTLTQDATGTMAYLEFEAIGIPMKMRTTIVLSVLSQKSTVSVFPDPATVSVIRCIWNASVFREKR